MSRTVVRRARPTDIRPVSMIHKEQFATHFLGRYSLSLIETFYACFLDRTVFLVSESEGRINGFVLGGERRELENAKHRFLSRNKRRYILETVTHPGLYGPVVRRLAGKLTRSREEAGNPSQISCRLLSISVSDQAKGNGVAPMLVQAFEREVDPAQAYGLSVKKTNERAIRFYCKMGFEVEVEQTSSLYFVKRLNS